MLALYSSGRTNGTILDIGEEVSHCVPIIEGYAVPPCISRHKLAGRHITDELFRLTNFKGMKLNADKDTDVVKDAKEKLCYLAQDYDQALTEAHDSL